MSDHWAIERHKECGLPVDLCVCPEESCDIPFSPEQQEEITELVELVEPLLQRLLEMMEEVRGEGEAIQINDIKVERTEE